MHTFEISCRIFSWDYQYLHDNLPHLTKVSSFVERTNFYASKGIMQIELRIFEYAKQCVMMKQYYLVIRCTPSIIMGDSKILLVDLEKYSTDEILERLRKRLYEINEFRYIKLDKRPFELFLASRADISKDILHDFPQFIVWLCNMSFPYGYHRMKRKVIYKKTEQLYMESCCFGNGSRGIIIYHKWIALVNAGKN